jgi:branched-chain amino acid transport system ATP-binding protein
MSTTTLTAGLALNAVDLESGYLGESVVYGASVALAAGKITALFGHNGAGKTTLMKAIAGLNPTYKGTVRLGDEDITRTRPDLRVKKGLVYLPQEQAVFTTMTVRSNLMLGATTVSDSTVVDDRLAFVIDLFPILGQRQDQVAGTMSGGEQRMVSMGIALMAGARVLMLDEPSLGLSPLVTRQLFTATQRLATEEGVTVLLVEQAIGQTLQYADHVYVLRSGRIVAEHTKEEALARTDWWEVF